MTTDYVKYLQDTLNGVTVQQQAARRGVSGSSQSSILKTAMRKLLQQKAVRSNKSNFDVIAHDKKVQHLNRHKTFWDTALSDYLDSVQQPQSLFNTISAKTMPPDFQDVDAFDNTREPIEFCWFFDDWDDLLDFCRENTDNLDAFTAACLAHNTLLNLYDFVERK